MRAKMFLWVKRSQRNVLRKSFRKAKPGKKVPDGRSGINIVKKFIVIVKLGPKRLSRKKHISRFRPRSPKNMVRKKRYLSFFALSIWFIFFSALDHFFLPLKENDAASNGRSSLFSHARLPYPNPVSLITKALVDQQWVTFGPVSHLKIIF